MMTDEQLAVDCQKNAQIFGELYNRYINKIYNFVYYRTVHKQTAEDLTSQIFFKAFANISQFESARGNFSAWIYQIARNTIIDFYRKNKNEDDIDSYFGLFDKNINLEGNFQAKQLMEKINQLLINFKPKQREIILMRLWDELSYKEIAALTGQSEENCKVIYSRAIAKLREQISLVVALLILIKAII